MINKETILRKITSRKFFSMLTVVIVCILVLFNADSDTIEKVTALIGAVASMITYTFAEAWVDKNRV